MSSKDNDNNGGNDEGDGIYPYPALTDTEEGQEIELKAFEEQERHIEYEDDEGSLSENVGNLSVEKATKTYKSSGTQLNVSTFLHGEGDGSLLLPRDEYDVTHADDMTWFSCFNDTEQELKELMDDIVEEVAREDEKENEKEGDYYEGEKRPPKPPLPAKFVQRACLSTTFPMESRKTAATNVHFLISPKKKHDPVPSVSMINRKNNTFGGKKITETLLSSTKLDDEPRDFGSNLKPCGHGHRPVGPPHFCHVCAPIPEDAVIQLKKTVGLDSNTARLAAFTLIKYLKEFRHTDPVLEVMKYLQPDIFEGRMFRSKVAPRVKNLANSILLKEAFSPVNNNTSSNPVSIYATENNSTTTSSLLTTSTATTSSTMIETKKKNENYRKENKTNVGVTAVVGTIPQAVSTYAKEQHLLELLRLLSMQNGAWGLLEDDDFVLSHLFQLTQLLTVMDSHSIKRIARCDRYIPIKKLCLYFALEKRWVIRSEVLNALELMAMKDKNSTGVIMESDLPVDLAKEIYQEYINNSNDTERILACCNFLVALIRSGFPLLADHLARIDSHFVYALLQISEGEIKMEVGEELRDAIVALILAFNAHFSPDDKYRNPVVSAISGREEADYLKQRMLHLLLNRELGHFNNMTVFYPSPWCDMVVKLGMDLLCCQQTTGFFMENDLNIFLAGLSVYIPELEIGDDKRTTALRLVRLLLHRLGYQHPGLRRVIQMLKGILMEKEQDSVLDQKIARKIAKEVEAARLNTKF